MSLRLMIEDLCPSGVPTMAIDDLLDYEQPSKYLVASAEYKSSYPTPVLTAGQTFILGYTDETEGVYPASSDAPVIIFDDFTTAFKWVDFPFKAKSSAMKMLTLKLGAPVSLRYVYYAMSCLRFTPQRHARHWIATYSRLRIPVPPPEVQEAIVELASRYETSGAALEQALASEVSIRQRQYVHYRDSILASLIDDSIKWTTLGEAATNHDSRRMPVTRSARQPGEIPYYGASGVVDHVKDHIFDGDYLLVSEDGANLLARSTPIAFSISGKTWVNNHAHVLEFPTAAERRFAEVYLNSLDLAPFVTGGAQAKLSQANLNRIPVPLVAIADQERSVAFLDALRTRVDALSEDLLSERLARRKQFESTLDRLLTFEEVA